MITDVGMKLLTEMLEETTHNEFEKWNHTNWGNAWYEGMYAGRKNKPQRENPYAGTTYEGAWEHGWEVGNEGA